MKTHLKTNSNKTGNRIMPVLFTLTLMLISMLGLGQSAYITNYCDNTVSIINVATNTVEATIAVGTYPEGVSVSADGSKVYVGNGGYNTVSVINSTTHIVLATIASGYIPVALGNFISLLIVGLASLNIEPASIAVYPNPFSTQTTLHTDKLFKLLLHCGFYFFPIP